MPRAPKRAHALVLGGQLDVRAQHDLDPVLGQQRPARFFRGRARRGAAVARLLLRLVRVEPLARRVEHDLARARVDDHRVARARVAVEVAQADDGGDAEAARDDRRVRSPAAHVGRNRLDVREVEFRDGRGHQLFGDDDGVLRQSSPAQRFAAQRDQQAPRHVLDVGAALAQVVVLDLVVDGEQPVGDDLHGPLAVDALAADDRLHVLGELAVFEHQQVRVEDVRVLVAERALGASS